MVESGSMGRLVSVDRRRFVDACRQAHGRGDAVGCGGGCDGRRGRSALAVAELCRERCGVNDWLINLDLRRVFDSVDYAWLLDAVAGDSDEWWAFSWAKRWLQAGDAPDGGVLVADGRGWICRGAVVSWVLTDMYFGYVFDAWMAWEFRGVPFERYRDVVAVHCESEQRAWSVLDAIKARMADCQVALSDDEAHVFYCEDSNRGRASNRGGVYEYERCESLFSGCTLGVPR